MPKYRRGSGSVYLKRGWCYIGYYVNGKLICEAAKTKDKAAARQLLQARLGQIAEGRYVGPAVERVMIDQLLQNLLIDYEVNQRASRQTVRIRVEKHLRPFFAHRTAHHLTSADVQQYVNQRLAERASAATINRELAALKRAFTLARRAEIIVKQPYIKMLEENNVRQGFFERQEFEQVLARLPDSLQPPLTFAYYTGWRIASEILPLAWAQVDLEEKTVRREPGTTKNKEGRTIYLPQLLWELIERQWAEHLEWYPECPLVFHREGRRIRDFRKAWRNACHAAGLAARIPHDFRRTAVRNLVRAGVPERVAMLITGHKTRSVFERYNIVSPGDLREAAQRLDQRAQRQREYTEGQVTAFPS